MRNTGGGLPSIPNLQWHPDSTGGVITGYERKQEVLSYMSEQKKPIPGVESGEVHPRDFILEIRNHSVHEFTERALRDNWHRLRYLVAGFQNENLTTELKLWDEDLQPGRGSAELYITSPGHSVMLSQGRFDYLLDTEKQWLESRKEQQAQTEAEELAAERYTRILQLDTVVAARNETIKALTAEKEVHLREMEQMRQSLRDLEFVRDELKGESRKWFEKYEDLERDIKCLKATNEALKGILDESDEKRTKDINAAWNAGYRRAFRKFLDLLSPHEDLNEYMKEVVGE